MFWPIDLLDPRPPPSLAKTHHPLPKSQIRACLSSRTSGTCFEAVGLSYSPAPQHGTVRSKSNSTSPTPRFRDSDACSSTHQLWNRKTGHVTRPSIWHSDSRHWMFVHSWRRLTLIAHMTVLSPSSSLAWAKHSSLSTIDGLSMATTTYERFVKFCSFRRPRLSYCRNV